MLPVTVVVPTLNRVEYLEKVLIGLAQQDRNDFEVIVVNGPSVDETSSLLRKWSHRLKVVECPESSSGKARNMGIAAASCEIVAFLDDDAVPPANWVRKIAEHYSAPEIAAVGGAVWDEPSGSLTWKRCVAWRDGSVDVDASPPDSQFVSVGADPFLYLAGCNASYRRSAVEHVGGFHAQLTNSYDDVELCCALIDAGYKIVYDPAVVVRHFRAPSLLRDSPDILKDPYAVTFGRTIFMVQHNPELSPGEMVLTARSWTESWRILGLESYRSGALNDLEYEHFVARAIAGVEDGLVVGFDKRPRSYFPSAGRSKFKRFDAGTAAGRQNRQA